MKKIILYTAFAFFCAIWIFWNSTINAYANKLDPKDFFHEHKSVYEYVNNPIYFPNNYSISCYINEKWKLICLDENGWPLMNFSFNIWNSVNSVIKIKHIAWYKNDLCVLNQLWNVNCTSGLNAFNKTWWWDFWSIVHFTMRGNNAICYLSDKWKVSCTWTSSYIQNISALNTSDDTYWVNVQIVQENIFCVLNNHWKLSCFWSFVWSKTISINDYVKSNENLEDDVIYNKIFVNNPLYSSNEYVMCAQSTLFLDCFYFNSSLNVFNYKRFNIWFIEFDYFYALSVYNDYYFRGLWIKWGLFNTYSHYWENWILYLKTSNGMSDSGKKIISTLKYNDYSYYVAYLDSNYVIRHIIDGYDDYFKDNFKYILWKPTIGYKHENDEDNYDRIKVCSTNTREKKEYIWDGINMSFSHFGLWGGMHINYLNRSNVHEIVQDFHDSTAFRLANLWLFWDDNKDYFPFKTHMFDWIYDFYDGSNPAVKVENTWLKFSKITNQSYQKVVFSMDIEWSDDKTPLEFMISGFDNKNSLYLERNVMQYTIWYVQDSGTDVSFANIQGSFYMDKSFDFNRVYSVDDIDKEDCLNMSNEPGGRTCRYYIILNNLGVSGVSITIQWAVLVYEGYVGEVVNEECVYYVIPKDIHIYVTCEEEGGEDCTYNDGKVSWAFIFDNATNKWCVFDNIKWCIKYFDPDKSYEINWEEVDEDEWNKITWDINNELDVDNFYFKKVFNKEVQEGLSDFINIFKITVPKNPVLVARVPVPVMNKNSFSFSLWAEEVVLDAAPEEYDLGLVNTGYDNRWKIFLTFLLWIVYILARLVIIGVVFYIFFLFWKWISAFLEPLFWNSFKDEGGLSNIGWAIGYGALLLLIFSVFFWVFSYLSPVVSFLNSVVDYIDLFFWYIVSLLSWYEFFSTMVNRFFYWLSSLIISVLIWRAVLKFGRVWT